MADKFLTKWDCSECFERFDMRSQAVRCCKRIGIAAKVCEVCGQDWETDEAAKRCCFKIANPTPAARQDYTPPRPIPGHLLEPDLGVRREKTY